jgi:hypothetical protein
MNTDARLEKLERFFKEVADLTVNHKVNADTALVFPSALGEALWRVDPDWCHNTVDPTLKETIRTKRRAALPSGFIQGRRFPMGGLQL